MKTSGVWLNRACISRYHTESKETTLCEFGLVYLGK